MAFELPDVCPVCQKTLAPDRILEDHLVGKHTHREVVRHLVAESDRTSVRIDAD